MTLGFGAIGFIDDYDKVKKRSHKGVSGRVRLLPSSWSPASPAWLIVSQISTHLYVPFYNGPVIQLGLVLLSSSRRS